MGSSSSRQLKVLVVGLDNSGKSTIISRMKAAEAPQEIPPTPGFQVEQFKKGKVDFTMFDMSGAGKYRNLWEFYYKNCQAIIFVVDSADKIRMCVAKNELETMLKSPELKPVPLLIYANKMDLPGAMNYAQVSEALGLATIADREWNIFPSNALSGEGIDEGVTWLTEKTKE
ncbi:Arl6 [Monocercomonoides exilis]|uniref:Arl6 n=1 Tax=Monocercomonoides exilis TaxID=2049356 RepID=UPI00355A49EA|nr:Arl6 [Monocercomonoides exilis]|eukprot:MONOS_11483.1-p1 / transcript=MONOS_11483.1 / gene=MONOS_11483 / organism=Monocercomonoides_exilis_PA203 / gene_product=Arl6 / transcript_product=Arl6 / location=Mono_scaffold00579:9491-10328(-) / protein_length=172 / sequence_SO=supercontig / SO=protein_coding / is_pseudo=false